MKQLLLILMILPFFVFGQKEQGKTYANQTNEYAIVTIQKVGSDYVAGIDVGQKWGFGSDQRYRKNGEVVKFQSPADALNFFDSEGWELMPNPLTNAQGIEATFLLRRKKGK